MNPAGAVPGLAREAWGKGEGFFWGKTPGFVLCAVLEAVPTARFGLRRLAAVTGRAGREGWGSPSQIYLGFSSTFKSFEPLNGSDASPGFPWSSMAGTNCCVNDCRRPPLVSCRAPQMPRSLATLGLGFFFSPAYLSAGVAFPATRLERFCSSWQRFYGAWRAGSAATHRQQGQGLSSGARLLFGTAKTPRPRASAAAATSPPKKKQKQKETMKQQLGHRLFLCAAPKASVLAFN